MEDQRRDVAADAVPPHLHQYELVVAGRRHVVDRASGQDDVGRDGISSKWYRTAIPRAEQLYDDYLAERKKESWGHERSVTLAGFRKP